MKLSHSGGDRLTDCGESYRLHYIEKIRPTWTTSALLFGDALDKTYNAILTDKQNNILRSFEEYYSIFLNGWTNGLINKDKIYIPTCPNVVYTTKDYNSELFTQEDYDDVSKRIENGDIIEADFDELHERKKDRGWHTLNEAEKGFYNIHAWHSMKNKARYFIQGYLEQVLPRIKKVHAVQIHVNAVNENKDAFTGIIDTIIDIDDHGTAITDNKSSSTPYKQDSVKTSKQLGKYVYFEGPKYNTNKGCYIVTKKHLKRIENKTCQSCGHKATSTHAKCNNVISKKRCNGDWNVQIEFRPEIQIIVDEISIEFQEHAVLEVDTSFAKIESKTFEKNFTKCKNWYGSRCPYYSLCHHDSMDGLVNLKDKNETSN